MSIDFEAMIKEAVTAGLAQAGGADIGGPLKTALQNAQKAITDLADAKKKGEIDDGTFQSELEREKKVMEAELISLEIAAESAIQSALNGALSSISKALI